LIHAGTIITAQDKQVLSEHTIVVRNNRIHALTKGYVQPDADDTVVDLRNHPVMPGLMDMHTHLSFQHGGPSTYLERFRLNGADYALKAANYARITRLIKGLPLVRGSTQPLVPSRPRVDMPIRPTAWHSTCAAIHMPLMAW
jgi:imidazolonepropionase-like amidohydrolase